MNDPRESLDWAFGGTNVPYEEIFSGYYSDKTAITCQYKYGNMIKERYQILCFSGAREQGWNNEMLWAHYGGLHSGVCLEFDEETLIENLKLKHPDVAFKIENVDYSNKETERWIHWQRGKSQEENMADFLKYLLKDKTLSKSRYWDREDEKRLVCINIVTPLYIPIVGALRTVYVGVTFKKNGREMLESVFKVLNDKCRLSMLIYQHNKFERWGIRGKLGEGISTCDFEDTPTNHNWINHE
jgi:hypothetical protein